MLMMLKINVNKTKVVTFDRASGCENNECKVNGEVVKQVNELV